MAWLRFTMIGEAIGYRAVRCVRLDEVRAQSSELSGNSFRLL
jgi:hypothetical protein